MCGLSSTIPQILFLFLCAGRPMASCGALLCVSSSAPPWRYTISLSYSVYGFPSTPPSSAAPAVADHILPPPPQSAGTGVGCCYLPLSAPRWCGCLRYRLLNVRCSSPLRRPRRRFPEQPPPLSPWQRRFPLLRLNLPHQFQGASQPGAPWARRPARATYLRRPLKSIVFHLNDATPTEPHGTQLPWTQTAVGSLPGDRRPPT